MYNLQQNINVTVSEMCGGQIIISIFHVTLYRKFYTQNILSQNCFSKHIT